ncbi:MAG: hypothetical protein AB1758_28150, partial [Candidatus Eremiobacterota bacterium]
MRRLLLILCTLATVACGDDFVAQTFGPAPAPQPQPADDAVASQTLGPAGGQLQVLDGTAVLTVPPGALPADTVVTLTATEATNNRGSHLDVVSPVCTVTMQPPPANVFDPPLVLSFPGSAGGPSNRAVCRQRPLRGQLMPGSEPGFQNYYVPSPELTLFDAQGVPSCRLRNYTAQEPFGHAVAAPGAPDKQVNPAFLTPPPTPPGMVYIGRHVVTNFVYHEGLSTAPLDRVDLPTDQIFIQSETRVENNSTVCDVIVTHVFAAAPPAPLPVMKLIPPPPPPGYKYLGYTVVKNFVMVETTVDLNRTPQETDVTFIQSSTTVKDGVVDCDLIVAFDYVPDTPMSTATTVGPQGQTVPTMDGRGLVHFLSGTFAGPTGVTLDAIAPPGLNNTTLTPALRLPATAVPPARTAVVDFPRAQQKRYLLAAVEQPFRVARRVPSLGQVA